MDINWRKLAVLSLKMAPPLDIGRVLGSGNFGVVYYGSLGTEPVAVKFCSRSSDIGQEARLLKLCDHTNVIKSHGVQIHKGKFCLVMELAQAGDLQTHLGGKKFSTQAKRELIEQLCSGLDHIHGRRILHRDVRPVNLLLKSITQPHIVFGDFGEARVFIEDKNERNTHDIVPDDVYTFKSDVYLLAIVAAQILDDEKHVCYTSLPRKIRDHDSDVEVFTEAEWRRAIEDSLDMDPRARPTAIEFRDAFRY